MKELRNVPDGVAGVDGVTDPDAEVEEELEARK